MKINYGEKKAAKRLLAGLLKLRYYIYDVYEVSSFPKMQEICTNELATNHEKKASIIYNIMMKEKKKWDYSLTEKFTQ